MSILNVNTIQPVGSAQTVTVSATDLKIGTTTLSSGGSGVFVGNLTGNVTGNLTGNINSTGVSTVTTLRGSSNTISIPTGHKIVGTDIGSVYAPGTIVQVVQSVKTDTFATSFGAVWGDLPGLSVNITPRSSSNKILVLLDVKFIGDTDASISRIKLVRNSTDIYIGDAASNRPRSSGAQNYNTGAGSGGYNVLASGGVYLDSPATTSATTYKVQGGGDGNSSIFYLNRTESDRDNGYYDTRTASSITVMEVAV
jgi:hypothetical protein